jgi:hypothetical protein
MSRGPGWVQQAVLKAFEENRTGWIATGDLCKIVYGRDGPFDRSEAESVKRAAKRAAAQLGWRRMFAQCIASTGIYYNNNTLPEDAGLASKMMWHIALNHLQNRLLLKRSDLSDDDVEELTLDLYRQLKELTKAQVRREVEKIVREMVRRSAKRNVAVWPDQDDDDAISNVPMIEHSAN